LPGPCGCWLSSLRLHCLRPDPSSPQPLSPQLLSASALQHLSSSAPQNLSTSAPQALGLELLDHSALAACFERAARFLARQLLSSTAWQSPSPDAFQMLRSPPLQLLSSSAPRLLGSWGAWTLSSLNAHRSSISESTDLDLLRQDPHPNPKGPPPRPLSLSAPSDPSSSAPQLLRSSTFNP